MTTDIRTPAEEDREQLVDVLRTSLNFTRAWADDRGPVMPLPDYRCAYVDGRIVAAAAGFRFRQWFGGRDLPMSGIYAVATLPEHRGNGLASAAVLQVMREARDAGMLGERALPGGRPALPSTRLRAGRDVQRASSRPGRDPVRPGRGPARRGAARPRAGPGGPSGVLPRVDPARQRPARADRRRVVDATDPAPVRRGDLTRGGGPRTRRIDRGVRRVPLRGRRGRAPRHRLRTGMPGVRRHVGSRDPRAARLLPVVPGRGHLGAVVRTAGGSHRVAAARAGHRDAVPVPVDVPRSSMSGAPWPNAAIRRSTPTSSSRSTTRSSRRTPGRGG